MKIVISPAKVLDYKTKTPISRFTNCEFLSEAKIINDVLREKSPNELSNLMNISSDLANLNWTRNHNWKTPFTIDNSRQSIFAFKGNVFLGIDPYTLNSSQLEVLQKKLWVLSGLYGVLKPLDLMQEYRLEMGTKINIGNCKNLYEFWKNKITKKINSELLKDEVLVNLASNEYFKVLDKKQIKVPIITPIFKNYKNGKLRTIVVYTKKARGLMVRFLVKNNIETTEEIKGFNYEGYAFDSNLSSENQYVFTR